MCWPKKLSAENNDAVNNITVAFRKIVCRRPTDRELNMLKDYYEAQRKQYESGALKAELTLDVGEFPRNKTVQVNSTAALMKTISLMYNLEETIVR